MRTERIVVIYQVSSDAKEIEARARGIAIEQSVECPMEAIADQRIIDEIVGEVLAIRETAAGVFEVRIGLAAETAPPEPTQLINMLFGNSSLQPGITLQDAILPASYAAAFGGPRVGIEGLRKLCRAENRAFTASALKPQGIPSADLAKLAGEIALGGLDIIKDDHGIADQAYSPFAERARLCAGAVRKANASSGGHTLYVPHVSGSLDLMRAQLKIARDEGIQMVMIAPMLVGLASFHQIVKEAAGIAVLAHPALGGASSIAPPFLFGKLFRLLGADVSVFPNYGGRFAYAKETCRQLVEAALLPWEGMKGTVPSPAGGMTLQRIPELLDFYGRDCVLLIGGSLLSNRDRLTEESALFAKKVKDHVQA